ncbi:MULTISPECIES: EutN/CcmL family microcompartment protein [Olsenella]|uniref:EutN/CcmL family microcompartment protein n=1 Tax=Olsenella TaxID=133925 RepID=UPI000780D6B0|nr:MULTISPECIES: EutN/CcmL family microcompartment protein [Olsenella]KXB62843.1 ethanolamine utilization protein EutN/carboxysome structural protein Ccml [Olsenella sp. DNF00959]
MIVGRLVGSIWATRKYDELSGMKLMRVEVLAGGEVGSQLICVDTISAGVGDRVIVTTGAAAYHFVRDEFQRNAPVDAVIVGIIDEDVSL